VNARIPEPRAGELFALAAKVPAGGAQRRKLLLLLAAYADAGEPSPPVRQLAKRLRMPIGGVDALLKLLERDGHLVVHWRAGDGRRNLYELRLGEGQAA
jgi:DNA-binding MarR family transcriptional regulator